MDLGKMRTTFSPENIRVHNRTEHHLRNLLFSGIVLAAILCIVSFVGLINEAVAVKSMLQKSRAQTAVDAFSVMSENLYLEMELRVVSPEKTQEIDAASQAWQGVFGSVKGSFNDELLNTVRECASDFFAAEGRGEIMYTYVYLHSALTSMVYLMLQSTYSTRAAATTTSLSLHSFNAALGSLMSRLLYYVSKPYDSALPYQEAYGFFMQYVTAMIAPYFSLDTITLAGKYEEYSQYAYELYCFSAGFSPTNATVELLSLDSMSGYTSALYDVTQAQITNNTKDMEPLYYLIAATVLILIALVLCSVVFCYYCTRSKETRLLASTFEETKSIDHIHRKYLPIMQQLRAVGDAEHRSNEVNRVYSIAACWMDVLRTLTPQLLFGAYPDHSRDWSLLEQEVHLSVGKTRVCRRVVVMEVSISVHADEQRPFYERELSEQLELLNELYRIVVSETNAAGGVVLGLRGNVSVLCAWNTTKVSRQAPLLALRAAHRIQYRLKDVGGMPRVLVSLAGGPVHVGTIAAGSRHYSCMLGGLLSSLSAMRLAGNAMGLTIVLDRNTAKHLPRPVARGMKPLAVMRLHTLCGFSSFVMYSGTDETAMWDEKQRAEYIRCFSLYQNNLLTEAWSSFQAYVAKYSLDSSARWLYELIVKPKFRLSLMDALRKGRSPTERETHHDFLGL